ncbi:MAG: cytochrome C oxidase assembly protein [Paracoccaceae bacterium]|nr:cytochrome C oxidase assembly protein [Paracoccaceae bacterium]
MGMRKDHELHGRRRSRNIGVFLALAAFVALLYWVTIVKMANVGNPWG